MLKRDLISITHLEHNFLNLRIENGVEQFDSSFNTSIGVAHWTVNFFLYKQDNDLKTYLVW